MKKLAFPFLLFLLLPQSGFSLTTEKELFSLAEARYYNQNYAIALETYNEFLQKYPLSDHIPDVQYRRAVCLYRLEQYREAIGLLKKIEQRHRSTRFLDFIPFWAGMAYYHIQDYSSAAYNLGLFLNKQITDSTRTTALFYKGASELALNEYKIAKPFFHEIIEN